MKTDNKMKTDAEITRILRKENVAFRKLCEAEEEICERISKKTGGHAWLAIVHGKIYHAILIFVDEYRRDHPESE